LDAGEAVLGDILIGGFLGGLLKPTWPRLPYFADDINVLMRSIVHLLPHVSGKLHVGHGGPLDADRTRTVFARYRTNRASSQLA
jgi:hypothetical protein